MKGGDYKRAEWAFYILKVRAHDEKTITYSELADYVGTHRRGLAYNLGLIQRWCEETGYPPLQVLVVNDGTGLPGPGMVAAHDRVRPGPGYKERLVAAIPQLQRGVFKRMRNARVKRRCLTAEELKAVDQTPQQRKAKTP